ncbi:MAG: hypothetical protein WC867_05020 [Candidatus Pacearchaeota archaeon]|jgi:hypothetical protein
MKTTIINAPIKETQTTDILLKIGYFIAMISFIILISSIYFGNIINSYIDLQKLRYIAVIIFIISEGFAFYLLTYLGKWGDGPEFFIKTVPPLILGFTLGAFLGKIIQTIFRIEEFSFEHPSVYIPSFILIGLFILFFNYPKKKRKKK